MNHLSSETIRLLSSSQVIIAAVSVVKELLENALDAKANSIDIKLDNYGFDKIEVQDNGEGIKASDVAVMAKKHYTSKITSHEDLENLKTYGFRGEALGSICSVAEVHITTKTASDEISTQYVLDKCGHIVSQKPSHLGQGTTVTVLNLFKNLPVRKQYFSTSKKCKEELKKIQDLLMAYGIIKPDVRIVLVHNKAVIWQKNKVSDHRIALMSVLGSTVMNSMVPFQHLCNDSNITINGFLPRRDANNSLTSSSSPERSWIFINQRPVYHKEILKIVRLYYSHNTSSHCCPVFFMNICVPTSFVDVNITPDKTQVMLQNKECVLSAVENVLKSLYPDPVPSNVHETNTLSKEAEISFKVLAESECNSKTTEITNSLQQITDTSVIDNNEPQSQVLTFLTDPLIDSNIGPKSDRQHNVQHPKDLPNCAGTLITEHCKEPDCMVAKDNAFKSLSCKELTEFQNINSKVGLETSDSYWSRGNSFKNSRGENLQPVKILPSLGKSKNLKKSDETDLIRNLGNSKKKSTNVIYDKTGIVTAFDLMGDCFIKKPVSAIDIFTQEYRKRYFQNTAEDELSPKILHMWEQLSAEEKHKYEEEAAKDVQHRYKVRTTEVAEKPSHTPNKSEKRLGMVSGQNPVSKPRMKTPFSNQQILDNLFKSQAEKKVSIPTVKIVPVIFNLRSLKIRYCRHFLKEMSETEEYSLMSKLNFPGAWVVVSKRRISLLNPYRMEEALLYKRLVDSHKIHTETLDPPIHLTERLLGTTDCLTVLLEMQKDSPKPNGHIYLSDLRLTANGFLIKIIPGSSDTDKHIEIEGMATNLPFYGISDLKEILNLVIEKKSKELCDCRPLKVLNYLEAEAVRLTRQLPLNLSKDDVYNTVNRMQKHLGSENKACIHNRPFLFQLAEIPDVDD